MKSIFPVILTILVLGISGCNLTASPMTPTISPTAAPSLAFTQPTSTPPVIVLPTSAIPYTTDQAILDRAAQVIVAFKNRDMAALSGCVSPQMGLRFSPYAAVKDTYQVFPADKLAGLLSDSTVYNWGAYYGTGQSIELSFTDYYTKFIYDEDFANAPQVSLNHRLGVGTTLDNATDFYPGGMVVEFYFPGFDPSLEGMDWRSLRLVFVHENDSWNLVGVIHDQWTT
jgi:hypothetical protein